MFFNSPEIKTSEKLEPYILKGLDYIKKGKFIKAKEHFRDEDQALRCGVVLGDARNYIVSSPIKDRKKETDIISFITIESKVPLADWKPTILLADVLFAENCLPTRRLMHNLALIYAEEWIHVLKDLTHRSLTGERSEDSDIAKYLMQKSVPLTPEFLSRHGRQRLIEVK